MKYLFLFLNLSLLSFGQKPIEKIKVKAQSDTIDYFYLNYAKGYHVKMVILNNKPIFHTCKNDLKFVPNIDSLYVVNTFRALRLKLLTGDTLINCNWYAKNANNCLADDCTTHGFDFFGKLKINRKSNILIIHKLLCATNKDVSLYKFKVLKFSQHEIILRDLQKTKDTKIYYFIKN